ncbi:hypothetical protein SAMN05444920_12657 [Nonomuraea solani]|uniref:Uncharacterized protein n=1 Tax=Nonomuraea solani TaxID=1144553 RepID=A0A1H6EZV0_9ACTN|nr:hypothetical protein [Nonomuraea solani]SEH02399.1 hypothetical protein SAMN05444920_12657 [Nonomuraea solani]
MNPAIAARIPLVCRTKPPGKPLAARIADLSALTIEPAGADHHDLVARACGVLNISALIASDAGLPDLAADLCWRQHKIFAESGRLEQEIAVMSLMPLINIARLLIREGDGKAAYEVLDQLYRAAQQRGATVIHGHAVDLTPLIHNRDGHRALCTELWIALLIDGARALAHQGRWGEAADAMAAHRGIGERLLDGRQLKIMALMEQGLPDEAAAMIDATVPAEEWEHTVAALLRIACRPPGTTTPPQEPDHVVQKALPLITQHEPTMAAFRARLGLTALDLTAGQSPSCAARLGVALVEVASTDAYAARDVLGHQGMRSHMSDQQQQNLEEVITAAGFGAGRLPQVHEHALAAAVGHAEDRLRALLGQDGPSRGPGTRDGPPFQP